MHYIALRKELLDILQVQVAKASGSLVRFGQGVTTVTFHFKNERRLYLTLPNHSSLQEFPNNVNNNFKVRLPKPIRLEGNWKVALFSISLPHLKIAFPSLLTNDEPLLYASWFSASSNNDLNKKKLLASFRLSDINDHVDMNMMSGLDFMTAVVDRFRKKRVEEDMRPNREFGKYWINSNVSTRYTYYPKFKVVDDDVVLDCSDVEFHDFGRNLYGVDGWKAPAILLNKKLAIEMGWYKDDPSETNPQFAVKLCMNYVVILSLLQATLKQNLTKMVIL